MENAVAVWVWLKLNFSWIPKSFTLSISFSYTHFHCNMDKYRLMQLYSRQLALAESFHCAQPHGNWTLSGNLSIGRQPQNASHSSNMTVTTYTELCILLINSLISSNICEYAFMHTTIWDKISHLECSNDAIFSRSLDSDSAYLPPFVQLCSREPDECEFCQNFWEHCSLG